MRRVIEQLWQERIGVGEVLAREDLPETLIEHFFLDCAAYALQRDERCGRRTDRRSWHALHFKGRWLEGEATSAQLRRARNAAYDAWNDAGDGPHDASALAWDVSWEDPGPECWSLCAACLDPQTRWPSRQLARHLWGFLYHRTALVRLLALRHLQQKNALPRWQQETEDPLF